MTVRELIASLQDMPSDLPVVVREVSDMDGTTYACHVSALEVTTKGRVGFMHTGKPEDRCLYLRGHYP